MHYFSDNCIEYTLYNYHSKYASYLHLFFIVFNLQVAAIKTYENIVIRVTTIM